MVDITNEKPTASPVTSVAPRSTECTATNFKLEIPDEIFQKIMWWMNKANFEVSGFGSLDFNAKENVYTVRDVILLKQKVGAASTEIDPHSLGRAMFRMKDEPNALKWHWHSHVNMGVFWSQDDRELIRSLGQKGWIIATVFNLKKEHKTAFQTQVQLMGRPHDIFVDDIPTHIQRYLAADLCAALDKEYDDNVSRETVVYSPHLPGWVDRDYGDHYPALHNPLHTLDGSRWEKFKDVILADDYDEHGYAQTANDWVYNPCYDASLKDQEEKFLAIAEMTEAEVSWMRLRSPRFDQLCKDYFLAVTADEASEEQKKSEAEWLSEGGLP